MEFVIIFNSYAFFVKKFVKCDRSFRNIKKFCGIDFRSKLNWNTSQHVYELLFSY